MRLHTDTLDRLTFESALTTPRSLGLLRGVHTDTAWHGSRQRNRGFDLWLSADERPGRRRRTNPGTSHPSREGAGTDVAATWDEWGIVLAALFEVDPNLTGGNYADAEHFHWTTGGRFARDEWDRFTPHDNHRWDYLGATVTGAYNVHECTGNCGAVKRFILREDFPRVFDGRQWGERIGVSA